MVLLGDNVSKRNITPTGKVGRFGYYALVGIYRPGSSDADAVELRKPDILQAEKFIYRREQPLDYVLWPFSGIGGKAFFSHDFAVIRDNGGYYFGAAHIDG